MDRFASHQKKRNLISISRKQIDPNSIQAFVLGHSRELVALQYVYDFNLDGLRVIRAADVTDVRCMATDKFQKRVLMQEGLVQRVPFESVLDLSDWRSVISQLAKEHALMILECEAAKEKDFVIGRVLKTTADEVHIRHFSGTANWEKRPTRLKLSDITSCQVGNNYLNVYQRHFERQADGKARGTSGSGKKAGRPNRVPQRPR
jgi:hypothetical protein